MLIFSLLDYKIFFVKIKAFFFNHKNFYLLILDTLSQNLVFAYKLASSAASWI